ncbi:hypothetical protein [Saliterribacillus persicus]|uniref:Uncharacterized protein n=1 Tax=Saliterribacillus persicus TaxID=930114 RepID=A0A368XBI9_9BACI|nr:hypothetical protein [Saliterribacillus persicus]RCW63384.1 hypothetical protein DFR57_11851 [Saliterribacillus persicus]
MGELLGAIIIMTLFYQIIRLVLARFIVIETHKMLISFVLAGLIGELIWYLINGIISLYYILGAFIVYIGALVMYNLKLRRK